MADKIDIPSKPPSAAEIERLEHVAPMYVNKFYISSGKEGIIRLYFADVNDVENTSSIIHVECAALTLASLYVLQALILQFIKKNNANTGANADIININDAKKDREPLN